VQDFAEDDVLEEMGIESPFELLGLYQGVDMVRRAISDPVQETERVFLYRRALLDVWCEGEDSLPDIVRHVLIHEIGHHFGYSDEDMEAIEDAY
jgi:predicted Zn-dependent protease with MMP-like domain